MWNEYVTEWSVGKATNTKYYRHVLAALGNTDIPAIEEDRVLGAQKILLALERDLIALLRIRYTKGVRLGSETNVLAKVFMAIYKCLWLSRKCLRITKSF
jgi:hypothetical protein